MIILLVLFSMVMPAKAQSASYSQQFQACVAKLRESGATGSRPGRQWGGAQTEIDYMSICQAMLGSGPTEPDPKAKDSSSATNEKNHLTDKRVNSLLGNLMTAPGTRPDRKN
jgi:hypothetical protein